MRKVRWGLPVLLALAISVAAMLAVACNGDDDEEPPPPDVTPVTTPTPPDVAPPATIAPQPESPQPLDDEVVEAVDGVLDLVMGDNFFAPNNLRAPLGEPLTIQLTNEGSAVHNMRIAGPDGEWNTADDIVSDPEMVLGGDTAVVEWTPQTPGAYTFHCDFHPTEQGGQILIE
jgi:plastocyanin